MPILDIGPDFFVPLLIFSIPIVAIAGGITAGIVRMIGQQRLMELSQRERIAAIERGVDVTKLPPVPGTQNSEIGSMFWSAKEAAAHRSQGLLIGGLVTMAVGVSLGVFLRLIQSNDPVWAVALIPFSVGLALIGSALLVRPKD